MTVPNGTNGQPGRVIENVCALGALAMAGAYVILAEALPASGLLSCETAGAKSFPWGVLALVVAGMLPKTVGRLTAGKVWAGIASRFSGHTPPPPA